jgi:hypothetical protein
LGFEAAGSAGRGCGATIAVVVRDELTKNGTQVALVENDDVVERL